MFISLNILLSARLLPGILQILPDLLKPKKWMNRQHKRVEGVLMFISFEYLAICKNFYMEYFKYCQIC